MSQTKQSADELPTTDNSLAEQAKKTMAEILLEKKAAAADNRNLPPHLNALPNHKGKKIGAPPRGTRKSMGKR
ncbi:MAG TPA: hypothetical protein ENJ65_07080 [Candidatus Tenderia electrophaga]|uniref:Uncharacterized protein n=1 Tax=Candidatus Tenderia electrophaga TaxID=1748243 RepID=A0A832N781_9GAMM|nr:hypothetical protein [Candidatus Tenderia electrophaga]